MRDENKNIQHEPEPEIPSNELTDDDLDQIAGGTKGIASHIKFDGVDGESTHKDHKGEIELLSWS